MALGLLASRGAAVAENWSEVGDASSFPEAQAQITRGDGLLSQLDGRLASGDARDAYCIRIVEYSSFAATTDSAVDPDAMTTFDSRLYLLDVYMRPLLANDNTDSIRPTTASTLSHQATDGSGVELTKNGHYILVIGGPEERLLDPSGTDIFDWSSPPEEILGPDPSTGRIAGWVASLEASGTYSIALEGVEPCLGEEAHFFFTKSTEKSRICFANTVGILTSCTDHLDAAADSRHVAAGFIDSNRWQDIVVANDILESRTCAGSDNGLASCVNVNGFPTQSFRSAALGFVDSDNNLDVILADSGALNDVYFSDGGGLFTSSQEIGDFNQFQDSSDIAIAYLDDDRQADVLVATDGEQNRACLSNVVGGGFFGIPCTTISPSPFASKALATGRFDGDTNVDAIFANKNAPDEVCLGDGAGGFSCADLEPAAIASQDVAVADLDADGDLDAVLATNASADRVCLGDGAGTFTCSAIDMTSTDSTAVHISLINDDHFFDAVFAGDPERICAGDGTGLLTCSEIEIGGPGTTTDVTVVDRLREPTLFADGFESADTSAWQ